MELRVLQYFLAVAREQSILAASESLHLSQPTLSRQLKALEEELGKQLFIRGNRKIVLTEEGMILRKRAEEIFDLVKKTKQELTSTDEILAGDIYIGAGETDAIRHIAKTAHRLQQKYPQVCFHMSSGDAVDVIDRLDKGLIDFGILLGDLDRGKYQSLKIPMTDHWGVLMRRDSLLADKDEITPQDLWDQPLIVSRQAIQQYPLLHWLGKDPNLLQITATYNLIFNASLMVEEGMGYALTLDKLVHTTGDSSLCFKPLTPKLELEMYIVWKKYQVFSKAAETFLTTLKNEF